MKKIKAYCLLLLFLIKYMFSGWFIPFTNANSFLLFSKFLILSLINLFFWDVLEETKGMYWMFLAWVLYSINFYLMLTEDKKLKINLTYLSDYLTFHRRNVILLGSIFLVSIGGYLTSVLNTFPDYKFEYRFLNTAVIAVIASFFARYLFSNNILSALKLLVNRTYSITVFRRFSDSGVFVSKLLPIIGAYGKVHLISDESFENEELPIYTPTSSLINSQNSLYFGCEDFEWKEKASNFINKSDLIIFYWHEYPTKNMIYEFELTKLIKGIDKMIMIVDINNMPKYKILDLANLALKNNLKRKDFILLGKESRLRDMLYHAIKEKRK